MLAPPLLLLLPIATVPLLGVMVIVLYFFSLGVSFGLLARTWNIFVMEVRGDWVRVPENKNLVYKNDCEGDQVKLRYVNLFE